jgi:hypothetical protein
MKKAILASLAALAVTLTLSGCGGGGTDAVTIVGGWSGTFVTTDAPPQSGDMVISIASSRTVTGTLTNTTSGDTGAISGIVDSINRFDGTISYGGGAVVFPAKGEFFLTDDNKMSGQVRTYNGATVISTANCNLTRQ